MKYLLLMLFSTIFALILEIVSLSHYLEPFRPHFILMIVIFWSLHTNKEYGIGTAWATGMVTDIALNYLIGLHGLIFALACFLIKRNKKWLNKLTIMEQSIAFAGFYLLQIALTLLVNSVLKIPNPHGYWWLFSILTSVIIWPLIYALLIEACYFFRILTR